MRIGAVGPDYTSLSPIADAQMLMNWYLETIESGQGKSAAALYPTPGLNLLQALAGGQGRGIITAQGRTFAVVGATLWEIVPPLAGLVAINRGRIVSDGKPVSMASGPTQVLIASAGNLYVFQLVAGTTTTITGAILPANSLTLIPQYSAGTGLGLLGSVSQVVYAQGFFYALISNSNQIQQSNALDGSTWQGVAETQVSVFSDNISGIYVDHLLLWVFGPTRIQPYANTGDFPFTDDPIVGGIIEQGLAASASIVAADNSIFWIGSDTRGQGIVWRANGYTPQRVSTFALEAELNTYPTIADAVGFSYQEEGHTFIQWSFPTAGTTRVLDVSNGTWHRRGYWNTQNGTFTQSRAGFHTLNFGVHLVLDPINGNIYQQSIKFLSDAGNPIRRIRRFPHISNEQAWIFHTRLWLDVEVGLGPTFQGSSPPTVYQMVDGAGVARNLSIADTGILQAPVNPLGVPTNPDVLFLNDQNNATSWQLTINPFGVITVAQLAVFLPTYPQVIPFVSVTGLQNWNLQLNNLGSGFAILQTVPLGIVGRGPVMTLRQSNNGGKTWNNPRDRDCGQAGEYGKRVIWNRCGRSRDRVYEISTEDAWSPRIIDAYLTTEGDPTPLSRYVSEVRKRA
jgi:hypothetical protein